MAQAVRVFEWSTTPLGAIDAWPSVLKTTVSLVINSQFPQCIVWGPGLVTIPNDAFLPILGGKAPALGRSFADVWSEAWDDLAPIAARAFSGTSTYIENFGMATNRHGILEEAFFTFCYSPIIDENGQIVGMLDTVTETSDTVRTGRHLELINKELGHRLKNVLAVTQAVTLQTIRRSASLDAARESVTERLAALGRATDVLTSTHWEAADLEAIARSVLAGHGEGRIAVTGPAIDLSSRHAISIALALHELATNAAKYGALSNASGTVDLRWDIEAAPPSASARFVLQWTEHGGPVVSVPTSRGFGSTLIERTLKSSFRGNMLLDYRTGGLVFTLDAPAAELLKTEDMI